jgi:hypothetical protein
MGGTDRSVAYEESKMNVYEFTAEELYAAFFKNVEPQNVLNEGRTVIAARLQTEHKLKSDAAFYAADEILTHAQDLLDRREQA